MKIISDRAAQARCYLGAGVYKAEYTGFLTSDSAHAISQQIIRFADGHPTLERIDTAVTAFARVTPVEKLEYLRGVLPGFIVVRPDQFAESLAYSELLLQLGIVRTVILPSQMMFAQEWLRRVSASS